MNHVFSAREATRRANFFDIERVDVLRGQQFVTPDRTRPDYAAPIAGHFPDVDLEDNRLPRSPRFTVSAGAQYTLDLDEQGTLKSRVDFYYRDDVSFRQYGNSADVQPSYTRTDLRLT